MSLCGVPPCRCTPQAPDQTQPVRVLRPAPSTHTKLPVVLSGQFIWVFIYTISSSFPFLATDIHQSIGAQCSGRTRPPLWWPVAVLGWSPATEVAQGHRSHRSHRSPGQSTDRWTLVFQSPALHFLPPFVWLLTGSKTDFSCTKETSQLEGQCQRVRGPEYRTTAGWRHRGAGVEERAATYKEAETGRRKRRQGVRPLVAKPTSTQVFWLVVGPEPAWWGIWEWDVWVRGGGGGEEGGGLSWWETWWQCDRGHMKDCLLEEELEVTPDTWHCTPRYHCLTSLTSPYTRE